LAYRAVMKTQLFVLGLLVGSQILAGPSGRLAACGGGSGVSLRVSAQQAVATDAGVSARAIADLRERGQAGLDALWEANSEIIGQHAAAFGASSPGDRAKWERARTALDKVSGQRDDYASRLYWYTDLAQAEEAAKASGKPILSLWLLGRLDEEYSCANSRLFRTTLYANAEVAAYLRQHFVLHWQTVRPVPHITIDFGDGRKIEDTITGNSIHYVLASDGEVIDALPGLYGAKAFLRNLNAGEKAALQYSALEQGKRVGFLQAFHREGLRELSAKWDQDLAKLHIAPPASTGGDARGPMRPGRFSGNIPVGDEVWGQLAMLHLEDSQLDAGAQALIQAKNPSALSAGRLATSKSAMENPMLRQIRTLQRTVSEDTVRNDYLLHSTIHEWLAAGPILGGVDHLNHRVYAELFLMPDSDPWLGLVPANTFTGLENSGLTLNHSKSSSGAGGGF
jgi:hypothetical protein